MPGIIGKKIGMTSVFGSDNRSVACTLIEAGPCFVTQIKTKETDKYEAVQIGYAEAKEKRVTQQMKGHFAKAGVTPCKVVKEFDFNPKDVKLGQEITVSIFEEGAKVNIVGTSKGKGFQGVVKRHGFAGVGGQTHGQHNRLRHPGSMGACSFPARVFKGKKLGGRTGGESVQMQKLQIIKIIPEKNLILVSGSIPGANGSLVYIQK